MILQTQDTKKPSYTYMPDKVEKYLFQGKNDNYKNPLIFNIPINNLFTFTIDLLSAKSGRHIKSIL